VTTAKAERLFLVLALVTYGVLCLTGLLQSSETFDEGASLSGGYTYLTLHDYRIDPLHPPCAKLLAAGVLRLTGQRPRVETDDPSWRTASLWAFSHRFLYVWNDAEALLRPARLVVVLQGMLLAGVVFWFTRLHYGVRAAFVSLFACVLSPQMIANGQVATTDLPSTLLIFIAVVTFERLLAQPSGPRLLLCGLALGLALMTKQTALLLLPIFGLLVLVAPPGGSRRKGGWLLLALGLMAYGIAWAIYGFRFALSPDPAFEPLLRWPAAGRLARMVDFARAHRLLPEAYLYSFVETAKRTNLRRAFLFGRTSRIGWWYYFPAAFLIKEPLPFLVGLGVALVAGRRYRAPFRVEASIALPILAYTILVFRSHLDIGLRHLLPIYPFLFVYLGRCALVAADTPWGGAVLGLMGLWQVAAVGFVHPQEIAYFNELVGGPSRGYRYLVDSNIDWGQDLKTLSRVVRRETLGAVKLSYFGTADPSYYGLDGPLLVGTSPRSARGSFTARVNPGDLLAVSVTNLEGVYLDRSGRALMEEVRRSAPFGRAGYSIYLYRSGFRWLWDPGEARVWGELAPVLPDYVAAVREDPSWEEAKVALALARSLSEARESPAVQEEQELLQPPRR
jgi:hypothetical protein